MLKRLKRFLRSQNLARGGAILQDTIQANHIFFNGQSEGLKCEKNIWIEEGGKFLIGNFKGKTGQLCIGSSFYMNHYSIIDCHYKITIGARVLIGPHCYICDFDHDLNTNLNKIEQRGEGIAAPVFIQDDVWIGAGVIILKGVTIGKRSIIAAGSLINKDVPSNVIVGGNPQKIIRTINL